jgi:hypothetical protein
MCFPTLHVQTPVREKSLPHGQQSRAPVALLAARKSAGIPECLQTWQFIVNPLLYDLKVLSNFAVYSPTPSQLIH